MSRIRSKWALLVAGSALFSLQIGQCLADFLEDAIVFRWVN
jgi:hypothetical protein